MTWTKVDGAVRTQTSKFGNEYDQAALVNDVNNADFIVAHNAKFELGWLSRCGVDLRSVVVFDTQIAEYVLGGNEYYLQQLSLNACLARRGLPQKTDLVAKMIKLGLPTQDYPESWMQRYCERDVDAAEELFLSQRESLRDTGLDKIMYQRCLVTPALADIEFNGLQLDEAQVDKLTNEVEDEYAAKSNALMDFCEGAEPSSTKKMRHFIYDVLKFRLPLDHKKNPLLTPSGDPSVAAPVLARLKPTTTRQRQFLELYNEWAGLHSDVTKYLRKFKTCCVEDGGLMRAVFNQTSTRTHRLSSSGLVHRVQFQNLNRKFKPLFQARHKDWLVGEADGAQLEFRVAAHLGRDSQALYDIRNGVDIHSFTADIIGVTRQEAKAHTFKPLYGGASGTANEKTYYETFAKKYSGVSGTQRQWARDVLRDKSLTTEWGMKYHWPNVKLTRSGYITNTTSIYNYPVQAFATAEIIPCSLVCAWHRMKDMKSFLVNTVHDSLIAEIHPDELDNWHEIARKCLIEDAYALVQRIYGISITVPLGAGVMIGSHWANSEAKDSEVVYEADAKLWEDAAISEGMV